jgi:hypothetical protein
VVCIQKKTVLIVSMQRRSAGFAGWARVHAYPARARRLPRLGAAGRSIENTQLSNLKDKPTNIQGAGGASSSNHKFDKQSQGPPRRITETNPSSQYIIATASLPFRRYGR